ncbi:hypothetical protein CHUAL_002942 [Chamberlinius hualienensis]
MEKEKTTGDDRPNFNMIRFIFDATTKLETSPLTTATAACIYHRFFQVMPDCQIDKKLVAAVAIYLAGKVEENHLKVRDVINVCHRMMFSHAKPLELGDEYFNLRDTFVNLELMLLRALRFQVNFQHPHKYLLQYFSSLSSWIESDIWKNQPVLQTALAFIQDFLHDPQYLTFKAQHIAVAAIYLSFQCYGVEIPFANESEVTWFEALVDDIDDNRLWIVVTAIINNYNQETVVS